MYLQLIILSLSCSFILAECNTGFTEIENECYSNNDLAVLLDILDRSCIDYDNDAQYGVVECILNNELDHNQDTYFSPLEIGVQLWVDSRLNELDCNFEIDGVETYCYLAESIILPSNLGNWTELKLLELHHNGIGGPLPASMNSMIELVHLDLRDNHLVGPIPDIGNLTNLDYIDLSDNSLSGEMPTSFSNSTALKYINLSDNLLSGHILREGCNFNQLEYLFLFSNQFEGGIPSCFGNLISLEYIDLSDNLFSGDLPHTITNIENLTYLNLSENNFTGELPDTWDNMEYLVNLNLSYNNLSGIIPPSLGASENIQDILLSRNNLIGWVPNSLSTLTNLETLKLAENELEGIIPSFIVYLESYGVYNNNFCPPYPQGCVLGSQNQDNCMNYEQGNINQDEIIDIIDVLLGMNLILGYAPFSNYETWAADVDGDGEVDVEDIIYLVYIIIHS